MHTVSLTLQYTFSMMLICTRVLSSLGRWKSTAHFCINRVVFLNQFYMLIALHFSFLRDHLRDELFFTTKWNWTMYFHRGDPPIYEQLIHCVFLCGFVDWKNRMVFKWWNRCEMEIWKITTNIVFYLFCTLPAPLCI